MPLFVDVETLRSTLGIGTLYSDVMLEGVCQSATDLIDPMLWHNYVPVIGVSLNSNFATVTLASNTLFNVGQTVTLSNTGIYDGEHLITGTVPYTSGSPVIWYPYQYGFAYNGYPYQNLGISYIQFDIENADDVFHLIRPYGKCLGVEYIVPYEDNPSIQLAALMVAVDIFQSRQAPGNGASSVDFGNPQPYKLGRSLLNRVSALLAPFRAPNSMVG